MHAVGKIGGEKALEWLHPMLNSPDQNVRGAAIDAIGKIGDEKALEWLHPMLKDSDSYVRREVVHAVGKIGGEKALEWLLPMLNDPDPNVCWQSLKAIPRIGKYIGKCVSPNRLPKKYRMRTRTFTRSLEELALLCELR